jgi:hypothetical protein
VREGGVDGTPRSIAGVNDWTGDAEVDNPLEFCYSPATLRLDLRAWPMDCT